MTFLTFSKRWAVLAAAAFVALLSASDLHADLKPMENVAKLTKPTVCYAGEEGLYLVDWDGQNNRLWIEGVFGLAPEWSRDGRRASIIAGRNYIHYILDFQTGRLTNMTKRLHDKGVRADVYYYTGAWWFPDGKRLACRGYDMNAGPVNAVGQRLPDVYILDIDKLTFDNVTNTPMGSEEWVSVSPDGEKIAFHARYNAQEGKFDIESPHDLFVMDADGSNVVNLTNSPAYERNPLWSPDGKKIAFEAAQRPEQLETGIRGVDVYIMDADGSNVERLTTHEIGKWKDPDSWSPDSKWILFGMQKDREPYDIYRVHVETKKIVRITHDAGSSSAIWVLAGKSRFLSVDPAGKKKAEWGALKAAEPTAPQTTTDDAE